MKASRSAPKRAAGPLGKTVLVIEVDKGLVTGIDAIGAMPNIEIVVADADTEGADEDQLHSVGDETMLLSRHSMQPIDEDTAFARQIRRFIETGRTGRTAGGQGDAHAHWDVRDGTGGNSDTGRSFANLQQSVADGGEGRKHILDILRQAHSAGCVPPRRPAIDDGRDTAKATFLNKVDMSLEAIYPQQPGHPQMAAIRKAIEASFAHGRAELEADATFRAIMPSSTTAGTIEDTSTGDLP